MSAAFAAGGVEGVARWARAPGAARPLPPVHLWRPTRCGAIDIRIRADGTWMHEGVPIGRPELVRLFSTILRKDADGFCLVTPAEKLSITVEDAPFVAVRVEARGDDLVFETNVGDEVVAGPQHAIRIETGAGGAPRPYLHVRAGLEARIVRAVFYELVERATEQPSAAGPVLGVASGGVWFALGPAA